MAHINPCPNPQLPPLQIELTDIPLRESHPQYTRGIRVVEGYWQQAMNMTTEDQQEYKKLIEDQAFFVGQNARFAPSKHTVYRDLKVRPTWAKYIFIRALYVDRPMDHLDAIVKGLFQSLEIRNFDNKYREYHARPTKAKKRKADNDFQRLSGGASGGAQTPPILPPGSSLPNSGPDHGQPNAVSLLGHSSPIVGGCSSLVICGHSSQHDLEQMENRLKSYIADANQKIREQVKGLRLSHFEAARSNEERMGMLMEKMMELEADNKEYRDAVETKVLPAVERIVKAVEEALGKDLGPFDISGQSNNSAQEDGDLFVL